MSYFLSYSQNLEDVILSRVFSGVDKGFYVDVGAWHPTQDSVTKTFYDRGWTGINIEPSRNYFQILNSERRLDVNLNVAISDNAGEMQFHEVIGSGLSSLEVKGKLLGEKLGFAQNVYTIRILPLTDVFEAHCAHREVHFLKIDVEGHEKQVLKSLTWSKFRPVVVLVEAVDAETRLPVWQEWEDILTNAAYHFVYFDGLNRFYLRDESIYLRNKFFAPPHLFDGFFLAPEHRWMLPKRTAWNKRLQLVLPKFLYKFLVNFRKKNVS